MISNDGCTHFVTGLLFETFKMYLKDVRQQARFACLFLVSPLAPWRGREAYQSACVHGGPSAVTWPRARATDEDTTATEREGFAGKTQEVSSRPSSLPGVNENLSGAQLGRSASVVMPQPPPP